MNYLPLLGILVVIIGFVLRVNPLLVVTIAAFVTGLTAGFDFSAVLAALGKAFNDNRFVTVVYVVLPVIGLLERFGLQQRARTMIAGLRGATAGRLLLAYLALRQILSAIGLQSVGGHAQTVRPLVAPMAEAAAEKQGADDIMRERVKALSAGTDNVGVFFGEDIFIAIASILLIKGTFETYGISIEPFHLSVWAIPTAILAFLIHGGRLLMLDHTLKRGRAER